MNKKGNLSDVLIIVPVFFIIVILAVILTMWVDAFNDAIQSPEVNAAQEVKDQMSDFRNRAPGNFDAGLLLALIASHIAIIFLGLLARSHPLVFPFLFVMLIILTIFAGFISNAYDDIAGDPLIESFADEYPMASWILDNFMLVTLVFGFIDIMVFVGLGALIESRGGV